MSVQYSLQGGSLMVKAVWYDNREKVSLVRQKTGFAS